MKQLSSALLLLLALVASSCSKDDNTVSPPAAAVASDYWMPTTAGAKSMFEGSSVLSRPGSTVDSTAEAMTMVMLGIKKPTLDGKSAYVVHTYNATTTGTDTTESYMALSATAITMYDSSLAAGTASTMLQTPLTVGNSWLYQPSDTVHYRIVSTSETVVTPAGTFTNCLQIRHSATDPTTGGTGTQDYYVARGVGLVRVQVLATFTFLGTTATYRTDMKLVSKTF